MAYTTIDDPSAYFHTQLYTGNGASSDHQITNNANAGDFKPDWLWVKPRSLADNHVLFDSSRGSDRQLKANGNDAEDTHSPAKFTFLTNGFEIDSNDQNYNQNSATYVAWQWKANGGTTTNVSSGTVDSNTTTACVRQINTTAGFGIYTYTADANGEQFIEHGLPSRPLFVIVKNRGQTDAWCVGHEKNTGTTGWYNFLRLNDTDASAANGDRWLNTEPSASVINLGANHEVGADGENYVCYAFSPIQGYSKFSKYVGNGNINGPFVHTGFKPQMIIIKDTSNTRNWAMADIDLVTAGNGGVTNALFPNLNDAHDANARIDFLSNGFKIRTTSTTWNNNNSNYIYMAWAKSPYVSSEGVPTTAF